MQQTISVTGVTRQREFLNGAKDTIPLMIGAAPFGMIFGALGVNSGLSPLAVIGFSLLVFAGSAQFIAAGLVAQGIGIGFIILTTFIVNLRHMLYAASLAPYMRHLSQRWMLPLAFWLTDESFAVVIRRYPQEDESPYKHWYHLGSSVSMYINWQLWTVIGLIAGTQITGLNEWGLDFAMIATFLGIVVPLIVSRPMLLAAVVAGMTSVIAYGLPNRSGLMLAAFAGISAGIIAELWQERQQNDL